MISHFSYAILIVGYVEITNHVLWPTELKRRVGKLSASRRYNQLPLLRSSPGGFEGSWRAALTRLF